MSRLYGGVDRKARILIIDDEPADRRVLEVMLAGEDLDVVTAEGAADAFASIASAPPDLILLDLMLPGDDGYQVAAKLKTARATSSIPIIIVTGRDDREARLKALNVGAEDFLSKPIDRAELCARVRNLLRLKAHSDYLDTYGALLEGEVDSRAADLIESERLYRSTFDAAPVGIAHVSRNGRWLRVNRCLCDLLGYSADELRQPEVMAAIQAEASAEEVEGFAQVVAGAVDRYVVPERRYPVRTGGHVWGRVNMSLHPGTASRAPQVICVIEDITERRALDAQLRQGNKMDAIGQLASGVAHDFNNLLTVILGFTELVAMDATLAQRHGADLKEVVKAAQRAAGLTKQLLAFSRQQILHTAPVDLTRLIRDMTGMLDRLIGVDIEIVFTADPDLPLALADAGQLELVVMNLVLNARDAMPAGGRVTIEAQAVVLENSTLHEEVVMDGSYVMLSVTDTGVGMSAETQRRVFEPFFTTKDSERGTGLGLSTTYGIVKQSKGYIWVYSELGRGTTFKIYLPRAIDKAAVLPAVPAAPAARVPGETVLLVEDEAGVRNLSRRILERGGYHVLEAANGDEAERLFVTQGNAIDLVVTDVVMPGCGGPELLARLHQQAPDLRVLYMSGYTEQSAAGRAGLEPGAPFVQKPFTAAEFTRQVRCALDR